MKKNNVSYPYPVLGIGDDILPMLDNDNANINVDIDDNDDFVFSVQLKFNDEEIKSLIEKGLAEYMIEIDCIKTLFHKIIVCNESQFCFKISRKDILDAVHFYPVVIAKVDIEGYRNSSFNPDYENASFNIKRGDILVCFNQFDYNVSIEYNKLMAYDSFMQIRRSETASVVSYELDCPKINVVLPSLMYDEFLLFGQDERYEEVIHASIVLNALLYALSVTDWVEENDKDEKELWKETILYRCKHEIEFQNYHLDNKYDHPFIAQELLKDPLRRMFTKLERSENVELENE